MAVSEGEVRYALEPTIFGIVFGLTSLWPFLFMQGLRKSIIRSLKLIPLLLLILLIIFFISFGPQQGEGNWGNDPGFISFLAVVFTYFFTFLYVFSFISIFLVHLYRSRFAAGSEFFAGIAIAVLAMLWMYGWDTYFPLI